MTKNWSLSTLIIIASLAVSMTIDAQKMRPAEPEIAGKAWILIDAATGTVILERNADLHLPPASLAKMMTTYLVSQEISENRLEEDTQVLISDNAWILGGAKTDGSTMFLSPRTRVSVIDLMHGVIIQSGNDAAIALAEHIAGGEIAFADLMNQQAAELGMSNTEYMNSTGLPAEGMFTPLEIYQPSLELLSAIIQSTTQFMQRNILNITILINLIGIDFSGVIKVLMALKQARQMLPGTA